MNSTAFQEYITYNEDYHIFICHFHGFAIPLDDVQQHFREFHKTISIDVRNQIIQHAKSLSLVKSENISTSSEEIKSIDCLKLITNEWQFIYLFIYYFHYPRVQAQLMTQLMMSVYILSISVLF